MNEISVIDSILKANDERSCLNRKLLDEKKVYTINLMGSPGAGRTTIIEKLISRLKQELNIAVIEGDLFTAMDAQKIESHGVPVVQVNTRGACHLDAQMLKKAIDQLNLDRIDLLIIENVGNLACPAEFALGEDSILTILSTTEGSDKPLKYPFIFEKSDAVILNKMDLIEFTNFDSLKFFQEVQLLNKNTSLFQTSCRQESGLDELCCWLEWKVKAKQESSAVSTSKEVLL
ncbi:hydrogenase nickel incorporation protein HypB [Bacillus tuaregi]|uniref:hydrogenase nickel incorporation protein HypB n=1 Tax=Bacillus tuaregi TaxID=1816695 RepID=UPI0008F93517|nr:hydrogenase nickel incorporation protein HypB [Bacillus tuaregi]